MGRQSTTASQDTKRPSFDFDFYFYSFGPGLDALRAQQIPTHLIPQLKRVDRKSVV